jgi:hypothetical protein
MEVEFSEMPILFVNIAGNYSLDELKKYAEELQDKIEDVLDTTISFIYLPHTCNIF